MVVYLEMPTKDVDSVLLHVLHHRPSIPFEVHFSVKCTDQYVLTEQFHFMRYTRNGAEKQR